MKKIRKTFIVSVALIVMTLSFILGVSLFSVNTAKAQVGLTEDISFRDSYVIGQTLNIPDASITVNGTECDTYKVVYYPNGKVYKTNSAVLKDNGIYKIEYRAEYQNRLYTKSFTFNAEQSLFSTTNTRSTAEYGVDLNVENYPDDLRSEIPGINISVLKGDKFNYNQVVDLSDNNNIHPFIELMYNPTLGPKSIDTEYIYVDLTDAYNPDNVVTIRLYNMNYSIADWLNPAYSYRHDAKARIFAAAAASGQGMKSVSGSYVSAGQDEAGCSIKTNNWLMKVDGTKPYEEQELTFGKDSSVALYFDYETNAIYVSGSINKMPTLVVDLDEMTYQDAKFDGFTTGEVFVSVYGGRYLQTEMNMVITYLDGQALDSEFSDASKVIFDVDKTAYGDNQIVAAVGKPFKIFSAKAIDMYHKDTESVVETRVYRANHLGESKYDIPIVNGYFTPNEVGAYTIEYSAKGFDGKVFTSYVSLFANETAEQLELISSAQQNGKAGVQIPVFDVEIANAYGKVDLVYEVKDASGKIIEVVDGKFLPASSGEYTVKVTATDYVGRTGSEIKTLTVATGEIILLETPILDDIYFTNKTYTLPSVSAFNYATNKNASVSVFVDGTLTTDNKIKFSQEGLSIIKYMSGEKELYTKTVKVINAFYDDADFGYQYSYGKFFVTDEFDVTEQSDMIKFTARNDTEKASISFANVLAADNFNLVFAFFNEAKISGVEKLNVYLTDAENPNEQLKVSFVSNASGSYPLYLNDNLYPYQNSKLYPTTENVFKLGLTYKNNMQTLTIDDCYTRDLSLLGYGDEFNGLSSNLLKLTIEFEGVSENFEFGIYNICGQALSNDKFDYVAPQILIDGNYPSFMNNGEMLDVYSAIGIDVISGKGKAKIQVITPSNNNAIAEDGTVLDNVEAIGHKLLINEYGIYTIIYTAIDDSGVSTTKYISIVCIDREPPQLNVTFNKTTAKVNEVVIIPEGTVSDNDSASLYCIVINPMGYKQVYKQGDSVKLEKIGIYTFRFYAVDLSGNSSTIDYTIAVK